jgi:hypothetical protein
MAGSVIGPVAGATIGGIFGSQAAKSQSGAANNAANLSADAARYSTDLQKEMFYKIVGCFLCTLSKVLSRDKFL